jgi:hypothetical protein
MVGIGLLGIGLFVDPTAATWSFVVMGALHFVLPVAAAWYDDGW